MALPSFAPFPPATIRLSLGPEEWEACLDAWLTLSAFTLRIPPGDLERTITGNSSASAFLTAFYHELASVQKEDKTLTSPKAVQLRKQAFRLVNRAWMEVKTTPDSLLSWDFLSEFCRVHLKKTALRQTTGNLWEKRSSQLIPILQQRKETITKQLDTNALSGVLPLLAQLAPIMYTSPDIGVFFMTGSDFLDSLVGSYSSDLTAEQIKAISAITYLGLLSCVRTTAPNFSLLSDHLYTLKGQADKAAPVPSLLTDIVTNSSLVLQIRRCLGEQAPARLVKLLEGLETYRTPSLARARSRLGRTRSKGKGKQRPDEDSLHMHRMSLVTQVQDLFPDLGSGFVMRLLNEYGDDVEQVTAHLLDDSLPPHLASLDRTLAEYTRGVNPQTAVEHLAPRSTPPPPKPFIPDRRNVFDDDELDEMQFQTGRLRIGKKKITTTNTDEPNKAAILSALAAFDSDDDERDDTYDVEDVGGTVDTAHPDGEPGPNAKVTREENDMALFTAYKSSPELFGRTFDVRRGQARQALKAETGMTDEAIEGWAIILQRDPKRLKRLEAQTGAFDGKQMELASTAYRDGTETEDSDAAQQNGGRSGYRGRGHARGGGRGGGRGGANVAGPSNDPNVAQAQRRKEANKGSRANHNRREQRAKKMARGGFPG